MPTMFWIWMVVAVVFLVLELLTTSFFAICFTVGALVAGIFTLFWPEAYHWQAGVFALVSVVLIPVTRRFAKKISKEAPELSNVDRMIGQTALVIGAIDPDLGGRVRYEGELWMAIADEPIPENAKVRIKAVTGTRLHVEKIS